MTSKRCGRSLTPFYDDLQKISTSLTPADCFDLVLWKRIPQVRIDIDLQHLALEFLRSLFDAAS